VFFSGFGLKRLSGIRKFVLQVTSWSDERFLSSAAAKGNHNPLL